MNVEILILGLALFCVNAPGEEGGGCEVPGDPSHPGRVYLVNATVGKCDQVCARGTCCEACGSRYENISLHAPELIFDPDQVDTSRITPCEGSTNPGGLGCWNVAAKALCVDVSQQGRLKTQSGASDQEKPNLLGTDRGAFGWVASMRHFDPLGGVCEGTDCFLAPSALEPSDTGAVISTFDLEAAGRLEATRLGRGRGGAYTLWIPRGMNRPRGRALADGVLWKIDDLGSFTIKECGKDTGEGEFLTFKTQVRAPRVILSNLPPGSMTPCPHDAQEDHLPHYALYYELFKPEHRQSCIVPAVRRGSSSHLVAFRTEVWIASGEFEPPQCQEDAPPVVRPVPLVSADTALCPPSKYP